MWQKLAEDFNDFGDMVQFVRLAMRLLLAAGLGAVLGWEREKAGKEAGLRTHILLAVGSAVFILAAQHANLSAADSNRVLEGLAAGVGFLGGGVILKREEKGRVRGLTTAAGLWLTAAVGAAAGLGRFVLAIVATAIGLAVLTFLRHIEEEIGPHDPKRKDDPPEAPPPGQYRA